MMLERNTNNTNMKLWRLEAIRGFLALYVAIGHSVKESLFMLRFGQEAVIVFFLISGFVIEYSHHQSRSKSFKVYFLKRFIRIYSVFIPMLVIATAIVRPDFSDWNFWGTLAGNLLMLQDFAVGKPNVIVPTLFASALWSLHYEWWFYMLYHPVASRIRRSSQSLWVAAASVLAALVYAAFPYAAPRLIMYFVIWWAGVDLARSYIKNGRVLIYDTAITGGSIFLITSILLCNAIFYRETGGAINLGIHPILELRHFVAAGMTLVVALIWQWAKWWGFGLLKPGMIIAPISYSLYISHQPFFAEAHYLHAVGDAFLEYGLYLTILIIFCWGTELRLFPIIKSLQIRNRPNPKF